MALTGDEVINSENLKTVVDEIRTGGRLEARRLAGGELNDCSGHLRRP